MLRSSRLLNPVLLESLARAGHGQVIVVADAGLPIPAGVPVVDLSLTPGRPAFSEVASAILAEGIFEGYVVAAESNDTPALADLTPQLEHLEPTVVDHEEFKRRLAGSHLVVRTGECTPFANIALIAGTAF